MSQFLPIRQYPMDPDQALLIWKNRQLILNNISNESITVYASCKLPHQILHSLSADEIDLEPNESIMVFSVAEETRENIRVILKEKITTGQCYTEMALQYFGHEPVEIHGQFMLNRAEAHTINTHLAAGKSLEVLCNIIGPQRMATFVILD
ncbi:MAG: hypothetical protein JWM56_163 [Candidatus Peribacteria bacterium]|nr:hypothetical protein [Candidatus Peribacteria bacterium]